MNNNLVIIKDFKLEGTQLKNVLVVTEGDKIEKYIAITDVAGK